MFSSDAYYVKLFISTVRMKDLFTWLVDSPVAQAERTMSVISKQLHDDFKRKLTKIKYGIAYYPLLWYLGTKTVRKVVRESLSVVPYATKLPRFGEAFHNTFFTRHWVKSFNSVAGILQVYLKLIKRIGSGGSLNYDVHRNWGTLASLYLFVMENLIYSKTLHT